MTTSAQIECRIHRVNNAVLLRINGQAVGMSWDVALELAAAIRRVNEVCRAFAVGGDLTATTDAKEVVNDITIKSAGPALVFELQGRQWFACNYRQAPAIADGVTGIARLIEEEARHEQLTADEAILLRTGLPIGLAYNPRIKRDALKRAEDVKFPGMVEPKAVFYPPALIQHAPS
jgi:hypothetical protein